MESYSKYICCNEEMKDKFMELSDAQQDIVCALLVRNINISMDEINKKIKDDIDNKYLSM